MMSKRTIMISDIHGAIDEFNDLLEKIEYDSNQDRLIILGDLTDRGPDSIGVLRKVRSMGVECIRGNHDQKILKWVNNGKKFYKDSNQQYYNDLTDDDIEFIFKMPLYIELDDVIIVHAGIRPFIPIDKQKPDDLMYLRYTDKSGNTISLKKIDKIGEEAAGAVFWTSFGSFGKNIVYGHHVYMNTIKIDAFDDGTACYGIDGGVPFGGTLNAFIWETKEVISVKAKKQYVKFGF